MRRILLIAPIVALGIVLAYLGLGYFMPDVLQGKVKATRSVESEQSNETVLKEEFRRIMATLEPVPFEHASISLASVEGLPSRRYIHAVCSDDLYAYRFIGSTSIQKNPETEGGYLLTVHGHWSREPKFKMMFCWPRYLGHSSTPPDVFARDLVERLADAYVKGSAETASRSR